MHKIWHKICKKYAEKAKNICKIKKHLKFVPKYAKYAKIMQICKSKLNMQNMHSPLCWWASLSDGLARGPWPLTGTDVIAPTRTRLRVSGSPRRNSQLGTEAIEVQPAPSWSRLGLADSESESGSSGLGSKKKARARLSRGQWGRRLPGWPRRRGGLGDWPGARTGQLAPACAGQGVSRCAAAARRTLSSYTRFWTSELIAGLAGSGADCWAAADEMSNKAPKRSFNGFLYSNGLYTVDSECRIEKYAEEKEARLRIDWNIKIAIACARNRIKWSWCFCRFEGVLFFKMSTMGTLIAVYETTAACVPAY